MKTVYITNCYGKCVIFNVTEISVKDYACTIVFDTMELAEYYARKMYNDCGISCFIGDNDVTFDDSGLTIKFH